MLARVYCSLIVLVGLAFGLGSMPAEEPVLDELGGGARGQALRVPGDLNERPGPQFLRGDSDRNGVVELTDAIKGLGYLFLGTFTPSCPDAADTNDDGIVDLSDPLYILVFLFIGGLDAPPQPFPETGTDQTPDELGRCR